MNIGWLLLWATLQVGYVPVAWDNGVVMRNAEYVEPGFGGQLFGFLTVEGSVRTYFLPDGFAAGLPSFSLLRGEYTIGARLDPTPWLRVGFLRWCSHAIAPYDEIRWPGDQGAMEVYARLRIGGATP